jgi:hypothetical protein
VLTSWGDCLPQTNAAYVAFRIMGMAALAEIDGAIDPGDDDESWGFLGGCVALLDQVPDAVQLDLLAETWAKHHSPERVEATLLDGAMLYAVCDTAADFIKVFPKSVAGWLRRGPRRVRMTSRTPRQILRLFHDFWGDMDWTWLEECQDVDPERFWIRRLLLGVSDESVEALYSALGRGRVSPQIAENLQGLFTPKEIAECLEILKRTSRF